MTALVLMPGLDGTGELFAGFAASLPANIQVITATYPTDIPMDYDALEPLVRKLLPTDKPYFLLAESFSGPLAVRIAASTPPGLRGLILCYSFIKNPHPACYPLYPLTHIFPFTSMPFGLLKFSHLCTQANSALTERIRSILRCLDNQVIQKRIRAVLLTDTSPLLATLSLPILYLRARQDRGIFRSSSEHIKRLAPQTRIIEFDAPHFMLQTLPQEIAATVTGFIESVA